MVGGLLLEGVGQLDDKSGETPLAGLEHALFRVGEARESQGREFLERLLGLQKARLEFARRGTER